MENNKESGWNEWSHHVLQELKRLDGNIEKMSQKLNEMSISIAELKIKAGMWGAVGAMVSVAVIALLEKFVK